MILRKACVTVMLCATTLLGFGDLETLSQLPSIQEDTIRVIVVRHGHSGNNLPNADQLSEEERDQLTGLGERQSQAIAEALSDQPIVGLYASPTNRTRDTLRPLAESLGARESAGVRGGMVDALTSGDEAQEFNIHSDPAFSAMQLGLTGEGDPATFSWRVQQWEAGTDPRPLDGESMMDLTKRVYERIRAFRTAYGNAIVICTHGDVIAALVGAASDAPLWDRWPHFESNLGSIHVIDVPKNGPARLRLFNFDPIG